MKHLAWGVVVLMMFCSMAFASAPNVSFDSIPEQLPMHVLEKSKTADGVALSLEFAEPSWEMIPGEAIDELSDLQIAEYPLSSLYSVEGMPLVPVVGSMFRLPPQSGVVINVSNVEYETISNIDFVHYSDDSMFDNLDGISLPEDPVDAWFPNEYVQIGEPALFHDFRVATMRTFPIQVNPALRQARVVTNMDVEISFEGIDDRNTLDHWPTKISEAFLPAYRLLLDWDEAELDDYDLYRGHVQVVMRNNAVLRNAMADWVEWKEQKGWILEYLTDADVTFTTSAIRNELISRYEEADPKFDYVCIVGDASGSYIVPAGGSNGDQEYSELFGNDDLADVGVGRISVEDQQQMQIYTNKVMTYERDPDLNNTSWYPKAMLNVSDNHTGNSKIMQLRFFRNGLERCGYTTIDTSWRIGNATAIQKINSGVSFYGARGYLGSGLSVSTIGGLTNSNETPVVIDVTCGTGNWVGGTSISEAYMRAGTTTTAKGGICGMSMATSGTRPDFNNIAAGGAGWAMLFLDMPTLGDMLMMGKVALYQNFAGLDPGGMNNFLDWFNLMGDPMLWTWTSTPEELDVTAETSVDLGHYNYEVLVTDNGAPIEGAWVTVYKVDDDDDVIARGVSDELGHCVLDVPITTAGEAMLTVTARNYAPYRQVVDYVNPADYIGYTTISFVDDGTNGTSGNGNGIAEAGETVGLEVVARNFGTSNQTNIELTADSDDGWVVSVSGTTDFGDISTGSETAGTGLILVDIDEVCQDGWNIPVEFTFDSDGGSWTDVYQLPVHSLSFALVDVDIIGGALDPGTTRSLEIELGNIGIANANNLEATLLTADPFLGIVTAAGTFPNINAGFTGTSSQFQVTAHPETFPGHIGRAKLVITNNSDQIDTVSISFQLGTTASTDPSGPDRYGYYAFDNTDTAYELSPTFDWVEIAPSAPNSDFNGTVLDITDSGENDDEAVAVPLPDGFEIQYYGDTFDYVTVVGNGYLAMGRQADIALARNRRIPSPLGSDWMVAPYWDELYTTASSEICYYYDEPNGRFIVEWYNMRHGSSANNNYTFQVIFYDQVAHPTYTGDTDILFQYDLVEPTGTTAWYYDIPYWSTGIMNGTHDDGISLWYWNDADPGACTLSQGTAILFTTNVALITGIVEGDVTDLATSDPIEGVTVRTGNYVYSTLTDAQGHYILEDVVIGNHDIVMEKQGFNTFTTPQVLVLEDETSTVNAALAHPEFLTDITEDTIQVDLGTGMTTDYFITITNNGNGPLAYTAELDFQGPESTTFTNNGETGPSNNENGTDELDDPWDVIFGFDLDPVETRNRGLTYDSEHNCFWVCGSDNSTSVGPNKLYKYTQQGELDTTTAHEGIYNQPVENRTAIGFYSLAYANDYIYGVDNGVLFTMYYDEEQDQVLAIDSVEVPVNTARYIAYDSDYDFFWMGDGTTDVFAIDPNGNIQLQYDQDVFPRGAGYLTAEDEDYRLYLVCRRPGQSENIIYKMNTMTGNMLQVFSFESLNAAEMPGGSDITYYWNPLVYSLSTLMDGGTYDRIQMWELTNNDAWIELDPTEGEIPANGQDQITIHLDGSLPNGSYTVWVLIEHNAVGGEYWIPVTMTVSDAVEDDPNNSEIPQDWSFKGVYPNPFNPVANISFNLLESVDVQARVYNLLGQQVAVLANQKMNAGEHTMIFDGSNLSSGVYFLRFNAGPMNHTQKMLLMK